MRTSSTSFLLVAVGVSSALTAASCSLLPSTISPQVVAGHGSETTQTTTNIDPWSYRFMIGILGAGTLSLMINTYYHRKHDARKVRAENGR